MVWQRPRFVPSWAFHARFSWGKGYRPAKAECNAHEDAWSEVIPVTSGSRTLKDATNEAIRYWINHPEDTHYLIGSTIGPHPYPDLVARLQSVISAEIKKQLLKQEKRDYPDYVVACVGGGSNAAGAFYHYIDDKRVRLIGSEAAGEGIDSGKPPPLYPPARWEYCMDAKPC
jgi:tryptophan synthase beta subunit